MRYGDIELTRNLAAQVDAGQSGGQRRILLQRHVVLTGRLDDLFGQFAAAFSDQARRACTSRALSELLDPRAITRSRSHPKPPLY